MEQSPNAGVTEMKHEARAKETLPSIQLAFWAKSKGFGTHSLSCHFRYYDLIT